MEYGPFLNTFLEEFLKIVLPVLATLLAGLAIQGVRWLEEKIKSERPDIYMTLSWLASAAVKSAEQAGAAGLIEDKKKYALDLIQKRLVEYGITVDISEIEAEIEKAVFEEINKPGAVG